MRRAFEICFAAVAMVFGGVSLSTNQRLYRFLVKSRFKLVVFPAVQSRLSVCGSCRRQPSVWTISRLVTPVYNDFSSCPIQTLGLRSLAGDSRVSGRFRDIIHEPKLHLMNRIYNNVRLFSIRGAFSMSLMVFRILMYNWDLFHSGIVKCTSNFQKNSISIWPLICTWVT